MSKKDYSQLTKDQLLELIEKIEVKKKYGLVWDEERVPETVVTNCRDFLPILSELKSNEIITDESEPTHILIEGDNYHSLCVLNYTHKGKVDLIYIDPPYNTGNKEDEEGFFYNDKRIDAEDSYRHSKWLNFMSHRLNLAKELLSDHGLIFISIDEFEFAPLKLLCDQIFGNENFINFLDWKKRSTGGQVKDGSVITQTEFIFIYAKNKKNAKLRKIENPNVGKEKWRDFRKSGGQWQQRYRPKQHYPFFFDIENNTLSLERTNDNEIQIFPHDSNGENGFWENGIETAGLRLTNGEFKAEKIKTGKQKGKYKIKQIEIAGDVQNVGNFIDIPSVQGKNEVKDMGLEFNNVKPLALLEFILKIGSKEDATILDFFAGSGTTGHCVLNLNKVSTHKRKFILCTNNENKLCDNVTYPRITKAIKGYTNTKSNRVDPLNGNLKYYKTSFVANNLNKDQLKVDITKHCTEMLCLKEGIFKLIKEDSDFKIFQHGMRYMAIYYDFANVSLDDLKEEMNAINGDKVLYCFTVDYHGLDKYNFRGWKNIRLEPIPQKILDVYKNIFKL
jgi:adenine-specific DNA-methyltransferase